MSTPLRSEGWSVRPSFVPHGSTSPVTLLADDSGLTQLAGEPSVAWQTPWHEFSNLQLIRFARGMALFATADGVRYCWRRHGLTQYEEFRTMVLAHGGTAERRRRRAGILVVGVVVLVASLAGGIGAVLNRGSSGSAELNAARAVNLSLKDLPSNWNGATLTGCSIAAPLSCIFPTSTQVITSTTTATTLPKSTSMWGRVTSVFEKCLGVSPANDRVFGAAGQQPDYQISSQIFGSSSFGGIELASTAQYYHSTTMVRRDTREMSKKTFGSCFTTSNVALLRAASGGTLPTTDVATSFQPRTFVRGWSRAGVATISLPGFVGPLHLVLAVVTAGHYEVTVGALVAQWPAARPFVANVISTVLSRITSTTSTAI
jgi:hypothetical protein